MPTCRRRTRQRRRSLGIPQVFAEPSVAGLAFDLGSQDRRGAADRRRSGAQPHLLAGLVVLLVLFALFAGGIVYRVLTQ